MNIISTIRCIIFSKKNEKELGKYLTLFTILILLIGIITWGGIISLIPIIITILYIISSYKNNIKWNKITILITAFIWIYYNYLVGAYITINRKRT